MSVFAPIALGEAIPPTPHAVSCSLPTMRAVRGYEEKDPAITSRMASGYPRFVVHPFARQLAAHFAASPDLAGRKLWLTSSARMARELGAYLGNGAEARDFEGIHGVAHADTPELGSRAKLYLQHLGGFLSSREAEDRLVRLGLKSRTYAELDFSGDAAAEVHRHLRRALPEAADKDLLLANSGANAVYAAFRAVSEVQAPRGRTIWIQLGWLYLDTIAVLKKFTAGPDDYVHLADVFDREALKKLLAEKGSRVAGLITEIPTNPLIQTPDVAELAELCRRHGVRLVLDPSVASPFSVRVLSHSDLLVNSLTKYTGNEGDIIAGLVAVNPRGPDAKALRKKAADSLEPVYPRDLARLAAQIGQTEEVLKRIEAAVPQVAAFLSGHPKVKEVFWAHHPKSKADFRKIARAEQAVGGMISFTLCTPLDAFYDRLRLPKGPSFGMKTTLICPFIYLAHYDLITTPEGRAELAASGVEPDLLRLCVGIEPPADIIEALAEALD